MKLGVACINWICVCFVLVVANSRAHAERPAALDSALRKEIQRHRLSGNPAIGLKLPSIESKRSQLGKLLFFSKALGGDFDVACVSCHHPVLGGGDNLPQSIGVGVKRAEILGPGRGRADDAFVVPRNASTTFNVGLWKRALFWDGRVEWIVASNGKLRGIRTPDSNIGEPDPDAGSELVAAQARFPITSPQEMLGIDFVNHNTTEEARAAIVRRLTSSSGWRREFRNAFGRGGITFGRIAVALSAYQRSQVFVNTPWSKYVRGANRAIGDSAKRGALLFFQSRAKGGAECASCHSGDFFTDEKFWAIAAPQIGPGKGDLGRFSTDHGRFRETRKKGDMFAFRTPSLLNVEVTGPYTHAGAYIELRDVIEHHLDPVKAAKGYKLTTNFPYARIGIEMNISDTIKHLRQAPQRAISTLAEPLKFSRAQIDQIVAFLRTLTDPCVKDRACLAPWLLGSDTTDPDGTLLRAVDAEGKRL